MCGTNSGVAGSSASVKTKQYPDDFKEGEKYPILFFFHGMGSTRRGMDFLETNCPLRRERIPSDLPFILVVPSCDDFMWFENTQNVIGFLKECIDWDFVDQTSVYLSGASMGGYFSWTLSVLHPELFAAAVICCGGGPYWAAHRIKFPVIAVHGVEDNIVLPRESEIMVEKINEHGGNATLVLKQGRAHNVWTETFKNSDTYRWLIKHKL